MENEEEGPHLNTGRTALHSSAQEDASILWTFQVDSSLPQSHRTGCILQCCEQIDPHLNRVCVHVQIQYDDTERGGGKAGEEGREGRRKGRRER